MLNSRTKAETRLIWMKIKRRVHIVQVPDDQWHRRYYYAEELLNAPEHEVKVWGEIEFQENGVADLGFDFGN